MTNTNETSGNLNILGQEVKAPLNLCLIERLWDPRTIEELYPSEAAKKIIEIANNQCKGTVLFHGMTRVNVSYANHSSCHLMASGTLNIWKPSFKGIEIGDCERGEFDGYNSIQIYLEDEKSISPVSDMGPILNMISGIKEKIQLRVANKQEEILNLNIDKIDHDRHIFYLSELPFRVEADRLFWESIAEYFGYKINLDSVDGETRGVIKHASGLELECRTARAHRLKVKYPTIQEASYLQRTWEDLVIFPEKIDGIPAWKNPQYGKEVEVFTPRGHAKHLFNYLKRIIPAPTIIDIN